MERDFLPLVSISNLGLIRYSCAVMMQKMVLRLSVLRSLIPYGILLMVSPIFAQADEKADKEERDSL